MTTRLIWMTTGAVMTAALTITILWLTVPRGGPNRPNEPGPLHYPFMFLFGVAALVLGAVLGFNAGTAFLAVCQGQYRVAGSVCLWTGIGVILTINIVAIVSDPRHARTGLLKLVAFPPYFEAIGMLLYGLFLLSRHNA